MNQEPQQDQPLFDFDLSTQPPGHLARIQANTLRDQLRSRGKFLYWFLKTFSIHTDERAWRIGAIGEEFVGSKLNTLAKLGWKVLHAVPIGDRGSDIDHVLIGPGGIWTINTKNHPGKSVWVSERQIRIGGHPVPYIRNSTFEAERVQKLVRKHLHWAPEVKAALVILNGKSLPSITIRNRPKQVMVLERWNLLRFFRKTARILLDHQVEELFELLRWRSAWQSNIVLSAVNPDGTQSHQAITDAG